MSILVDIEKRLGDFHLKAAFQAENEVLALLGASGCGKSVTLRCIAGIERPDRGRIVLDGVTLFDSEKRVDLTPQKRRTGLLFQNYALFPNMTVEQNIRAGTKRDRDAGDADRRVADIMERFGLTELSDHYPAQLSGGQQQRTALARILVSAPNILLLDEPFSALDSHLRFRLEQEVREVMRSFGKTVILVSHDRDEVFRLSDKIAVMNAGRVETFGSRERVFSSPGTRNAAILTGCKNISPVKPLSSSRVLATDWGMELETAPGAESAESVGVRMHDICAGSGPNAFLCDVVSEIENPFSCTVMLRPAGVSAPEPIGWELDKELWRTLRADKVEIHIPPEAILPLRDQNAF